MKIDCYFDGEKFMSRNIYYLCYYLVGQLRLPIGWHVYQVSRVLMTL